MLSAIDKQTGEVLEISRAWGRDRVEAVRKLGIDGRLICKECKTKAMVAAGDEREWYFRHEEVPEECPFASLASRITFTRIALRDWLRSKWEKGVKVEYRPAGSEALKRPVDVWVETPEGKRFAYWIFGRRATMEDVAGIKGAMEAAGAEIIWIIATKLRTWDDEEKLTTIERFCLGNATKWDDLHERGRHRGSLYYHDSDTGEFQIVRAVVCYGGDYFGGWPFSDPLDQIKVVRPTGAPVHEDEAQRIRQLIEKGRQPAKG